MRLSSSGDPCGRHALRHLRLYEAPTVAAISRHLIDNSSIGNQVEVRKTLAQFAGLTVAHEDGIADMECERPVIADGRLHFACAFEREQFRSFGQIGYWLLFWACRARGDVATAQACVKRWSRTAHNLDGVSGGGRVTEIAVVIEERGCVEARTGGDLRHNSFLAGGVDAARAAAVDEARQ